MAQGISEADSSRVSFTSSEGTGTWEFVYDTTAGIPAVIKELHDGTPVYHIREPNGALIARVVGSSLDATTTRYYHFDALGSTRKLTDKDGVVTDTYTYDAWGNTTHSGSTEQPYQYVGQLGYYTHWQDEHLDLLQLGVRFYDPQTGRFTQRDPARYEPNLYGYGRNCPTALVDPSGLMSHQTATCLKEAWCMVRLNGIGWGITSGMAAAGCAIACLITGPAFVPCFVSCFLAVNKAMMLPRIIQTVGLIAADLAICLFAPPQTDMCGGKKYNTPCLDAFPRGIRRGLIGR